ncbi:glycosyltransferase [Thermosipho atlanticus]|uniref:Glycosyltransferase, catalytic subunit of cellulose synthase and poly-beta-1,6-N-acetylglucosamine synthase n=1 Tax=Thermosipho atlanticus DSM 15807 TaxID=1123380 RepID=A0A1M5U8A6_9BACT|nr:glycosyltransferase family 2 protein [Thermosipho atlanticus]SHH59148.1 Glycosyltransferase, catalytic subunit of cellulose synthase and poly-beta-1,6-N-acetylglucosamine synthase [Thermosipho atlanticus DSM 15807]
MLIVSLVIVSYFIGWLFYANYRFLYPRKSKKVFKVSIIIPARNEELNIGKLLKSIGLQTYPIHEIIVVDDNSTDKTAEVAGAFENVKIVSLKNEPPEGWNGKPWACWNGYLASTGEILLFIDADVELTEKAVESLIAEYEKYGGLFSVWPYQRLEKRYEHFNYMFNIFAVSSTTLLKVFGKAKPIGAFGPVVLTSKEDYEKTGGHSSVSSEIVEDLRLGQVYLEKGIKVNNYLGHNLIKFRMYPKGLKELLEGTTKNMAVGLQKSNFINTLLILVWFFGILYSIPLKLTPFKILLYFSYVIQFYLMTRKVGDYDLLDALIYPFYSLFFILTLLWSIYKTVFLKKVSWKGREIIVKSSTNDK